MGNGFAILVWDSWGAGLVRVNPRLLDNGELDMYGNPKNWFSYKTNAEKERLIEELTIGHKHFMVIE